MSEDNKVEAYLKKASVEAGAVLVWVAASPIAGPIGSAVIAGVVKPGIERAIDAIGDGIGQRQRDRGVRFLDTMASDMSSRDSAGEQLRDDGFMDGDAESDWASALEHAYIVAIEDVTNKKARHLGHLMAKLPYNGDISMGAALFLIDTARDLTYEEYCILALARAGNKRYSPERESADYMILLNMIERIQNTYRLVGRSNEGLADVTKSLPALSPLGNQLYELLQLNELNPRDIDDMEQRFRRSGPARVRFLDRRRSNPRY